jgi:hypothetical protein
MVSYSFSSIPSEGRELGALAVERQRWRRRVELPRRPELGGGRSRSRMPSISRCTAQISLSIPVQLDLIRTMRSYSNALGRLSLF